VTEVLAPRPRVSRASAVVAALALGLGGALVIASPAAAATFTVTNTNPNGAGSLQQAMLDANGAAGSEITFGLPGAGPWIISVPAADPLPLITESTTITGPGSALLTIQNADTTTTALFADGCSYPPVTDVTITGLTVDAFAGTGVDVACVNLTASDLQLTNNLGSGLSYSSAPGNTADLNSITSNTNAAGIYLFADSGVVITATGLLAAGNTNDGIDLQASSGGSIDVGGSDSSSNGQIGYSLQGGGLGTSVVLHDSVTSTGNTLYGVEILSSNQAQLQVNNSDISDNTQGNIAGQINSGTATITGTSADDSPFGGGFGFDVLGGGTLLVTNSSASGNADSGGGATAVGSTIAISGSTFDSNGLADDGGGFLLWGQSGAALTIDGSAFTNNSAGFGGGIEARLDGDSTLDITSSRFADNHALPCGCAGSGVGGGLYIQGVNGDNSRFTLTDSQVTGNDATGDGAGLYFEDLGIDSSFGTLGSTGGSTVLRTTIDGNLATTGHGGGVYIDNWSWKTDGVTDLPAITFDSSTISNNFALNGSGIYADKGTDNNADLGILLLTNSTVSGNASTGISAIMFVSAFADGALELSHSTVASNGAALLGGVVALGSGEVDLDHALIADNGTDDLVVSGLSFSSRYSLVQNDLSGLLVGTGDITGVDPKLAPLANNGGSTKTMLIAPGSPAYNAGDPAFAGIPAFDQRGQARVYQVIDIGAVEWHPALALTGGGPQPEVPLWGMLFLFIGTALVAASRIRQPV
jgi:hypothetical protein